MSDKAPIQWTKEDYAKFGDVPMVNKHEYHQRTLFDKPELIALLDEFPRKWLQAFTMGDDPCRPENGPVWISLMKPMVPTCGER